MVYNYHYISTLLLRVRTVIIMVSFLILSGLLTGCIKNEFHLIFQLPDTVNSTYRLTYYASNSQGGIQIETAVAIATGKADVKGITRYPTLVTLTTNNADIPAAIFYVERGDKITISGDDANPFNWIIDGNEINKELTDWRLKNKTVIEAASKVRENDSDFTSRKKLNAVIAKYIESHQESKVSPLLLFSYFDASIQPEEFNRLSMILEKSGASEPFKGNLTRHDIITASTSVSAINKLRLKDIAIRTQSNTVDTLPLATTSGPSLIYYWRKDDPHHKEFIDTLKTLVKWRSDSASMIIADIGFTSDSLQWASSIRRDSLKGVIRAFSPRGLADSDAMQFGVRSTPWIIVGSGKGKVAYAGSDISEAIHKFRSLKPKN